MDTNEAKYCEPGSKLTTIRINNRQGHPVEVCLPEKELFRVNGIFTKQCYKFDNLVGVASHPIIVDVGANAGLFAVYAKIISPGSQIHCFEPSPRSIRLLENNLQTYDHIHIYPLALSNFNGTAELYQHPWNSGSDTMQMSEVHQWSDQDQKTTVAEVAVKDAGRCWDEIGLDGVDILKVDTEGSEVEIIRSLGRRISKVKYLFFEYHSESDRRQLDTLLKDFTLIASDANKAGRGEVKYANHAMVSKMQRD